ncbi:Voltage-dependent anion channel-forming protein YneE/VCCN1/2-like protein [Pleurotus pulmonarius]
MVAHNPLFHGRWTLKKFNATVVNDIWPEVLFFSAVATMVYLVSTMTSTKLVINTGLLTVLGTVLGLVISFRTSTAYERYQDGRKMWTNINIASRNLAQFIWIHVPTERPAAAQQRTELEAIIEKKTMVNLVQAFSVAVKHLLRGEPGIYYQDLYPLICHLPRYANMEAGQRIPEDILPLFREVHAAGEIPHVHPHQNVRDAVQGHKPQKTASLPDPKHDHDLGGKDEDSKSTNASWYQSLGRRSPRKQRRDSFDPEKALAHVDSEQPLKPARNPPETTVYDYVPLFRFFKWVVLIIFRRTASLARMAAERNKKGARDALGRKRKVDEIESNVPIEICLYLSSYTAYVMKQGLVTPAIATALTNNLSSLQDTMSNLDRIRSTPLPFAYQAHLRMSLWLYLFFLPFQLFATFGNLVIPATAFASFLLLGFLEIGQEIEDPFGYDANDLDVDGFCLHIEREIHEITAHHCPTPDVFAFSPWNQPFAPADRRTAETLLKNPTQKYTVPDHDINLQPGMASIRRTLLNSWRTVDRVTRDS